MSQEDAALLRLAFEEAAKNQRGWLLPLDAKEVDKKGNFIRWLHPWHDLYDAVTATNAGIAVIEVIRCLREEIERLEKEVCRLNAEHAGKPAYRRPTQIPDS